LGLEISGDVRETIASPKKLQEFTRFTPSISLSDGLKTFYIWAKSDDINSKLFSWVDSTQ